MQGPFNVNGGLTLIPTPGFEPIAVALKATIEEHYPRWIDEGQEPRYTPVDIAVPTFGTRASGEPFCRLGKKSVGGHDCVILTSGPGTPEMLIHLFLLLAYLAGRRARRITLITAYFPLGRSEKDEGEEEFALTPIIVDLIMTASQEKLDRIISVDLHASQVVSAGKTGKITEIFLGKRVLSHTIEDARRLHPDKHLVIAFPDDTAAKRAELPDKVSDATRTQQENADAIAAVAHTHQLDIPFVYCTKRRTSSRSARIMQVMGAKEALKQLPGSLVITFDDEIGTGGTNIDAARKLKSEHGVAVLWAVVSHGVLCGDAVKHLLAPDCPVDRVIITDTIPVHNRPHLQPLLDAGKLVVVSWIDDLAKIAYFMHWDESVRALR